MAIRGSQQQDTGTLLDLAGIAKSDQLNKNGRLSVSSHLSPMKLKKIAR